MLKKRPCSRFPFEESRRIFPVLRVSGWVSCPTSQAKFPSRVKSRLPLTVKRGPWHQHPGVRQAHVQQQSHIHQHLYGDYLGAVEKARWGEGGGAGCSQGHSVQALGGCFEADPRESLARNGPREPAPTPQSIEVIQWGYSVTTMREEREHGSTVTSPGGRGLSSTEILTD